MTVNSIPAANLPLMYVNGLGLAWGSNTTITVATGQCRDSTDTFDIVLPAASTTLNAAVVGLNGIDTGALGASTMYAVFAIANSTGFLPTGVLLSTSPTAPVMPARYDLLRRIGYVVTDGSSHIVKFYQTGGKRIVYDAPISVLSGGSSATFASVSLLAAVPPIANATVLLSASYTPATAANSAIIRTTGSSAVTGPTISGVVAAKAQFGMLEVMATVGSIDYIVTNGSDTLTLFVVGYTDSL